MQSIRRSVPSSLLLVALLLSACGTPLATPQGSMHGEYFCVAEDGHRFEVKIPEFVLTLPSMLH